MICMRCLLLALVALLFAGAGISAMAQDSRTSEIDAAHAEYADIRTAIETRALEDPGAAENRLRQLRDASRRRLAAVERDLANIRAQLGALGPPPGEGEPPESEDLAAQRAALNQELARLTSQQTRIAANIFEANDLLARISAARIETFYEKLLQRQASPLTPAMWGPAVESAGTVWSRIAAYFSAWSERKQTDGRRAPALAFILGALAISALLFGPVDRWIAKTFAHAIEKRRPTPARRVVAAGLKMLARAAPGLVGGFIIIETLRAQGVISEAGEPAARALWFGLVAYLLVGGFLRGLFAPANPSWRIAPVEVSRGQLISALIISIVIIFGLKILVVEVLTAANGAPELVGLIEAAGAIAVGVLLFMLCRTRLWRGAALPAVESEDASKDKDNAVRGRGFWRITRRLGRAVAVIIIVAALTGYIALADFVASRFYYLAIFLAFAWFARALLKESARWLRRRLRAETAREDDSEQNFQFWSNVLINIALFFAVLPGILILFGVPAGNVGDLAAQALFGFTIGGVQIPSLAKFAVAIAIFILIMALTKVAQRGFEKGPFAHTHIDHGVQNSLITLIGYGGLVVALFAAISAMGFDLSNLALIAGALSVGIGFGLQSIVNNFVSGLILLFERPIKVGDWVVTASGEGTVKKISVRSTEIETFNRASIIVPNSELISQSVTNWTHKNRLGRIIIPVGVSYKSDPELVRDVLLKCAKNHPQTLAYPAPYVTWQDFGASSLDFDVRVFIRDIGDILGVKTDLRFAIFKALKEAGIEIPFPQRDLHVISMPRAASPPERKDEDNA